MFINQTMIVFGDGDILCQNARCDSEEMPYVLTIKQKKHGLKPGTVEYVEPADQSILLSSDVVIGFKTPEMIDHFIDQLHNLRSNLVIEKLHTSKED